MADEVKKIDLEIPPEETPEPKASWRLTRHGQIAVGVLAMIVLFAAVMMWPRREEAKLKTDPILEMEVKIDHYLKRNKGD